MKIFLFLPFSSTQYFRGGRQRAWGLFFNKIYYLYEYGHYSIFLKCMLKPDILSMDLIFTYLFKCHCVRELHLKNIYILRHYRSSGADTYEHFFCLQKDTFKSIDRYIKLILFHFLRCRTQGSWWVFEKMHYLCTTALHDGKSDYITAFFLNDIAYIVHWKPALLQTSSTGK